MDAGAFLVLVPLMICAVFVICLAFWITLIIVTYKVQNIELKAVLQPLPWPVDRTD